mmetsp:Transcript_36444/g.83738  ORF Transcript_36444/g.83738 Transcript_36444/m.83738 type:complete len:575 (-) Transcript_36444:57-1781(-)
MALVSWPCDNVVQSLDKPSIPDLSVAALVTTVETGIVTQQHLKLLQQAQQRLERAGFLVAGAWFVPKTQGAETQKAAPEADPQFDDDDLLHHISKMVAAEQNIARVAKVRTEGVPTLSAVELVTSLASAIRTACGSDRLADTLRVFFFYSGTAVPADLRALQPGLGQGHVFIPTEDDLALEHTNQLHFVAEPFGSVSSSEFTIADLIEAAKATNSSLLSEQLSPEAASFILQPSPEERAAFVGLASLSSPAIAGSCAWPCRKLQRKLTATPLDAARTPAVLLLSDILAPTEKGHLEMLTQAKRRLEAAGHVVLGAWLSPSLQSEDTSSLCLSADFRVHVANVSVDDDDDELIEVSPWECTQEARNPPHVVADKLQAFISEQFATDLAGHHLRVFLVCGEDANLAHSLQRGIVPEEGLGLVVVPNDADSLILESPHTLGFTSEPVSEPVMGSKLFSAIQSGVDGASWVAASLAPGAARLLVAPTRQEQTKWEADLAALGVKPQTSAQHMLKVRDRLKVSFRAWLGQQSTLSAEDFGAILGFLDPSLKGVDVIALLPSGTSECLSIDEVLDAIFTF